jgi:hypothetical protein
MKYTMRVVCGRCGGAEFDGNAEDDAVISCSTCRAVVGPRRSIEAKFAGDSHTILLTEPKLRFTSDT